MKRKQRKKKENEEDEHEDQEVLFDGTMWKKRSRRLRLKRVSVL